MAVGTLNFNRSGVTASVTVDVVETLEVLDAIMLALSGPSLALFMEDMVAPYLQNQMINRFGDHGGQVPGGHWAPLQQSTIRIRQALGFTDGDAINERTGELLQHLLTSDVIPLPDGAQITVPEAGADGVLERKLRTAQQGYVQGVDDMIPGAKTPPRPVLALDALDLVNVMQMLQLHVILTVSGLF